MAQSAPYVLVDGHSDFVNRIRDCRRRHVEGSLNDEYLPELRAAGVRLTTLQVGGDSGSDVGLLPMANALEKLVHLWAEVDATPDATVLLTRADLRRVLESSTEVGFVLMLEGAAPLGVRPELVSLYHRLGVRMIQLTWNNRNAFADGCAEAATRGGLSRLGIELLDEMGRHAVVPDVSHLSDFGVEDVLARATGPVIASHSNARALCPNVRNLTDDHIRRIAETGGVIGINFFPNFLRSSGRPSMDDVVAHIRHLLRVGGEDAVALGPDFIDYLGESVAATLSQDTAIFGTDYRYPDGLERTADLGRLFDAMASAGLPDRVREKVGGKNWLRIYESCLPPW